jgi:hypothetical protein
LAGHDRDDNAVEALAGDRPAQRVAVVAARLGGSVAVLSPPVGRASPVLAPQLVLDLGAGCALVGLPLPNARFQLACVDARRAFGVTLRSATFGWH